MWGAEGPHAVAVQVEKSARMEVPEAGRGAAGGLGTLPVQWEAQSAFEEGITGPGLCFQDTLWLQWRQWLLGAGQSQVSCTPRKRTQLFL